MRPTRPTSLLALALPAALLHGCASAPSRPAAELRVRNNHELAYAGPVQFATGLPDGTYAAPGAVAEVRGGTARVVASLAPGAELALARVGPPRGRSFRDGPFALAAEGGRLDLRWEGRPLGALELGLLVRPGTTAGPEEVVPGFRPLDLRWTAQPDGTLRAEARRDGFLVQATVVAYGGGWADVRTRLTREDGAEAPAYVALVRRVTTPGAGAASLRFNGRVFDGAESPSDWDRDFWYTRGVDWISWKAGALSLAAVNGFTPAPTVRRDGVWKDGSHFYVWERTLRSGDALYLVSEVAGPNPEQAKSRSTPILPYAPLQRGDTVDLRWRLALAAAPAQGWEESQLRGFAGYRAATGDGRAATVQVGVPAVSFGTSYFPYSTLAENFDFYRTPGLDRETWWAFSPTMWKEWRTYVPRMDTDLHIIRAMGFEWVRLHHLELLQEMDRAEALAFLDYFTGAARGLGLRILVDTEGPADWVTLVAGRYPDVVQRIELENEVLLNGIKPGDPARWDSLYRAAKAAAPGAQVFLTAVGDNGMFERLRAAGVPFDRVGLHAYKHGPQWKEAYSSHALGTADYAAGLGKEVTLGEFNWKNLTRLSPETRLGEMSEIYRRTLEPRAIPEVFEFQFHETLTFNPSIAGGDTRHYEPVGLDRRPKPEGFELMRLIREYARPDAPVRELPLEVRETRFDNGTARAVFTVANRTAAPVSVTLRALAFDGVESRLASPASFTLRPGESREGVAELRLTGAARPGTYHHFVEAAYGAKKAYGWGVAANPGAPAFDSAQALPGRVVYPQGAASVGGLDWSRPLAVAFGADAPWLEVETAYQVANTLQSATGRPVRLSSTQDLPDSLAARGLVLLVGTAASNPLVARAAVPTQAGKGVVAPWRGPAGEQWLLLTGADKADVQAAEVDLVLRFWKNAKDSALRLTGMERGAALGNRATVTVPDPP
ncbi:MAG: hypothetical protein JO040_00865 [Gemmatimonadetes bacterium]|nr:hypothetical protein [Gemmatimonadota bacterium]